MDRWCVFVLNHDIRIERWLALQAAGAALGLSMHRLQPAHPAPPLHGIDTLLERPAADTCADQAALLQAFLSLRRPRAVILHDNTVLSRHLPSALDDLACWEHLWDVAKLHWRPIASGITRAVSPYGQLVSFPAPTRDTLAYAITARAASRLVAAAMPDICPARPNELATPLRVRGYALMPVRQARYPSEVPPLLAVTP